MWKNKAGRKRLDQGQNLIEYALILGIVTVALVGMQTYFKRGVQGVVKVVADDYGPQGEPVKRLEKTIKQAAYSNYTEMTGKNMTSSTMSGATTRIVTNLGNSSIRTETAGSTVSTTESFSLTSDYNTKQ